MRYLLCCSAFKRSLHLGFLTLCYTNCLYVTYIDIRPDPCIDMLFASILTVAAMASSALAGFDIKTGQQSWHYTDDAEVYH
jgi:hypothetical protein